MLVLFGVIVANCQNGSLNTYALSAHGIPTIAVLVRAVMVGIPTIAVCTYFLRARSVRAQAELPLGMADAKAELQSMCSGGHFGVEDAEWSAADGGDGASSAAGHTDGRSEQTTRTPTKVPVLLADVLGSAVRLPAASPSASASKRPKIERKQSPSASSRGDGASAVVVAPCQRQGRATRKAAIDLHGALETGCSAISPRGHDDDAIQREEALGEVEDDAGIHKWSIDAKLPSGVVCGGLTRIRSTLNGVHCGRLATMEWFDAYVPSTMQSLMRRLIDYEGDCVGGVDLDLELAYKQLTSRGAALILLHRGLKAYVDSRRSVELIEALKPFQVLRTYLAAVGLDLAPDLGILHGHAVFLHIFTASNSIVDALATLNVRNPATCHEKIQEYSRAQANADTEEKSSAVKGEQQSSDEGEKAGGKTVKRRRAPKKVKSDHVMFETFP